MIERSERIDIRTYPAIKKRLYELSEDYKLTQTEIIENLIQAGEIIVPCSYHNTKVGVIWVQHAKAFCTYHGDYKTAEECLACGKRTTNEVETNPNPNPPQNIFDWDKKANRWLDVDEQGNAQYIKTGHEEEIEEFLKKKYGKHG